MILIINMTLCLEMALWDQNFGLKVAEWDQEAPGLAMQKRVFTQMNAVGQGRPHVVMAYCHPREYPTVEQALLESRYTNIHPFFVYKHNQNAIGFQQYTFAVDTLVVGYFPKKGDVRWNASSDPTKRHNLITTSALSKHFINPSDGKKANVHEKPSSIMRKLVCNHTNRGDWVLVIGSGSGGEVIGALEAGCHVVAVERDQRQFDCLRARLVEMDTVWKEAKDAGSGQDNDNSPDGAAGDGDGGSPSVDDDIKRKCVVCGSDSEGPADMHSCAHCDAAAHRRCCHLVYTSPDGDTETFVCSEPCLTEGEKTMQADSAVSVSLESNPPESGEVA